MAWATIHKPAGAEVEPNVVDYEDARRHFDWARARAALDGLPGGAGLNIAHEAVDRWADRSTADRVALRCIDRAGVRTELTYGALKDATDRFAAVLGLLGVEPPAPVFLLLPRRPEVHIAALGAMKARCPVSPLFPAFGPEPVRQRMALGAGQVLVTTEALYRRKVRPVREELPDLAHVLLVDDPGPSAADRGVRSLAELMAVAPPWPGIGATDPEEVALLHFTSGTTGTPKGAVHVHDAVVAHHSTGRMALDLHPGDVFWCTADPGWVTGMSYGVIAPLTNGVTSVLDEGEFDADRWYGILEEERVTVWYTAPTAVRMLMRAGPEAAAAHDLSALRFVASVGEPLNPEGVVWGQEVLGVPIHDNWWQTETGGIMIANLACADVKPGSMGRALPGVEATVLARDPALDGAPLVRDGVAVVAETGVEGHLALRPGWPSMFRGYLHDPERYERCFTAGLVRLGGPRPARRGRLPLVRRPGRRRHQVGGAPHRTVRGRERAHGAPARRGGRGHRYPGSSGGGVGEGVRVARAGSRPVPRAGPGAARVRPVPAGARGGAPVDRVRSAPAPHPERQDHAQAPEGTGARPPDR